jgi:acetamidase/formamidase
MAHHTLKAAPDTVRIGQFNAIFPPVLTIASGDTVDVQCVSGRVEILPAADSGLVVPDALHAILGADLPAISLPARSR